MRIPFNFKDVPEQDGARHVLPNSYYKFEIMGVKDSNFANGDPVVYVNSKVVDGIHPETMGQRASDAIVFPAKNSTLAWKKGITKKFLHSCGLPFDGDGEADSDEWVGKYFYAFVKPKFNKKNNCEENDFQYLLEEEFNAKIEPLRDALIDQIVKNSKPAEDDIPL